MDAPPPRPPNLSELAEAGERAIERMQAQKRAADASAARRASGADGPGMEHCCCGKVHFVGAGASNALATYLDERAQKRKREPKYERGSTTVVLAAGPTEVAWAFPIE